MGDVFTKDRFTLNVGVAVRPADRQELRQRGPANAAFPNVVPAVSFAGSDENLIEWNTISPRVGLRLRARREPQDGGPRLLCELCRAARVRHRRSSNFGENPIQYGYLAYGWNDTNGDRFVQPGEVNLDDFQYYTQHRPQIRAASGTVITNAIDRNLKPKRDHEFILGIDREVAAETSPSAPLTRSAGATTGATVYAALAAACGCDPTLRHLLDPSKPSDYIANAPVTANGFTASTFSPNAALVQCGQRWQVQHQSAGLSHDLQRRRAHFEQAAGEPLDGRVAFSYNDWKPALRGHAGRQPRRPTPAPPRAQR